MKHKTGVGPNIIEHDYVIQGGILSPIIRSENKNR